MDDRSNRDAASVAEEAATAASACPNLLMKKEKFIPNLEAKRK
jgi:hypothetical protein